MASLAGKAALITGSVRGIGLAAARRLAAAGCHVVLNGFDAATDIEGLRTGLEREHGVRVLYSSADLRVPAEIGEMVATTERAFGAVDILINNAVVRHEAPVEDFSAERWDEGIAVNLSAAFHTIRLTVGGMKQRHWGRIINVSSIFGLKGAANRINYVTSKTALIGLTRGVAMETLACGVTCNAVCPGTVETPVHLEAIERRMAAEGLSREDAERRFMTGKQPLGRLIPVDNTAALIAFLCSDEAAEITGVALPVDGGWSIS
jgi:3-hydroxybutyrate dehydrogenase